MNRTSSLRRTIVVDGSPEPVRAMRALLASFQPDRSVADDVVRAVVLAFGEALDNAWEHGTSGRGEVRVRLRYAPRFVMVSLLDAGSQRVPLGKPVQADVNSERGRGFQLMNKLMAAVHVRSYSSGGTRVSMLKRLDE